MHGFDEPGTLLVVISVLVCRIEEVGSIFSDFEDRKTIKSGRMFKVVWKARFLRQQVWQNVYDDVFPPIKALNAEDLEGLLLVGALEIRHRNT